MSHPAGRTAVLLSGGLDSAVLLADEATRGDVVPVYVTVGLAWEMAERAAVEALLEALRALKRNGDSRDALPRMLDWDERQRLVRLPEYIALEKRYAQ